MGKKALLIIAFILITGFVFFYLRGAKNEPETKDNTETKLSISENDPPVIVSTKPAPLEEAIISAADVIEITFNRPLENVGEFKSKIEPKIEYKVELSGDRKTAKILPVKPFELGLTYTLFIGTETKFDGVGRWGMEKNFHFKTIPYRGV